MIPPQHGTTVSLFFVAPVLSLTHSVNLTLFCIYSYYNPAAAGQKITGGARRTTVSPQKGKNDGEKVV